MKTMTALLIIFAIGLTISAYFVGKWSQFDKSQDDKTITINTITIDTVSYMLAVSHLKKYEGLMLEPYIQDGKHYIGYGHQIRNYEPYLLDGITKEYADTLLHADLRQRILTANRYYDLTGNQALAMALLMYNVGEVTRTKDGEFTTIHRMLCGWIPYDEHAFVASWVSFCKWNGVVNKRLQERREFEIKIYFKN